DPFVVERDDARPAENFVLDDDAPRQITTALQRHEIADAHIPLDVDERPDHTMAADNGMVADKDEVADARVLADLHRFRDDAVVPVNGGHSRDHKDGDGPVQAG